MTCRLDSSQHRPERTMLISGSQLHDCVQIQETRLHPWATVVDMKYPMCLFRCTVNHPMFPVFFLSLRHLVWLFFKIHLVLSLFFLFVYCLLCRFFFFFMFLSSLSFFLSSAPEQHGKVLVLSSTSRRLHLLSNIFFPTLSIM